MKSLIGYSVQTLADTNNNYGLHAINVPPNVGIRVDYRGNMLSGFLVSNKRMTEKVFGSEMNSDLDSDGWAYFLNHVASSEFVQSLAHCFHCMTLTGPKDNTEHKYSSLSQYTWLELPNRLLNSSVYYLPKSYAKFIVDALMSNRDVLTDACHEFINEYKSNLVLDNNVQLRYGSLSGYQNRHTKDDNEIIEFRDYRVEMSKSTNCFKLIDPIVSPEWMLSARQYVHFLEVVQGIYGDSIFQFNISPRDILQMLLVIDKRSHLDSGLGSIFKLLRVVSGIYSYVPYSASVPYITLSG